MSLRSISARRSGATGSGDYSSQSPYRHFQCDPVLILAKIGVPYTIEKNRYSITYRVVRISSPHSAKVLIMRCCHAGSQIAYPPCKFIDITREEIIMNCPKCKGLMMLGRFSDFFLVFYAWKCINCGAIIDRKIYNNRRNSLAAKTTKEVEAATA